MDGLSARVARCDRAALPATGIHATTPRPGGLVDADRVIGRISGDAHERAIDGGEQIEGGGRIITRRLGQRVDTDHAGLIDAKVELPPATSAAAAVFRGGPLTGPTMDRPVLSSTRWMPSSGGTGRRRRLRC